MADLAFQTVSGPHHPRLPLLPSDEQSHMREAVRSFLAEVLPSPSADAAEWNRVDPGGALWLRMARELGLQGLTVPEDFDGQGFGLAEAAIVFEELGRSLCSAPLLGSMGLAGRTLLHAGSPGHHWLTALATGTMRATAALESHGTVAASDATTPTLTGRIVPLIDGVGVDHVVVAARHPRGTGVYLVDTSLPGVELTPLPAIDLTRGFARLTLTDVPAEELVRPDAVAVLTRARAECVVLLAAESVGAARGALESAVQYAGTREQFGRPIGSFQALKHRMADMLVSIEGAAAIVRHAAVLADLVDKRDDLTVHDLSMAASVAKVASDRALSFAAAECIQIHGGIGFTWEYSAHLAYRRGVSNRQLLGSPESHRDALVSLQVNDRGR